jgi:putative copper export protein
LISIKNINKLLRIAISRGRLLGMELCQKIVIFLLLPGLGVFVVVSTAFGVCSHLSDTEYAVTLLVCFGSVIPAPVLNAVARIVKARKRPSAENNSQRGRTAAGRRNGA